MLGIEQHFKVNTDLIVGCLLQTLSFSLHKTITDGLELGGLIVDYCDKHLHLCI